MYDWHDDIKYVSGAIESDNALPAAQSDIDDIIDIMAREIVDGNLADDPSYYDGGDLAEIVDEEMSEFLDGGSATIWGIPLESRLYDLLVEWYDGNEQLMLDSVRSALVLPEYDAIFFVTGCGYDVFSADLLGGTADGVAANRFDDFVASRAD